MKTINLKTNTYTGSFLAMVFQKPSILLDTKLKPEHFENEDERKIFKAFIKLNEQGKSIDVVNLYSILNQHIEGLDADVAPEAWRGRQSQIVEQFDKNQLQRTCKKVLEQRNLPIDEMKTLLNEAINSTGNNTSYSILGFKEVGKIVREQALKNNNAKPISTGFVGLNNFFRGWMQNNFYIVGARPSQGKSALLMNFALRCPVKFGFISIESSKEELLQRMLLASGVEFGKRTIFDSKLWSEISDEKLSINGVIYDAPNASISQIELVAQKMVQSFDVKVIFLDYLQIISNKKISKIEAVADTSTRLKEIARRLNIPIVVSAQLNREAESKNPNKLESNKPMLSNLADSSQIEKDADVVILIWNHNQEIKDHDIGHYGTGTTSDFIVAKNRNGKLGTVRTHFNKEKLIFKEI